jgi:hypothetical protein
MAYGIICYVFDYVLLLYYHLATIIQLSATSFAVKPPAPGAPSTDTVLGVDVHIQSISLLGPFRLPAPFLSPTQCDGRGGAAAAVFVNTLKDIVVLYAKLSEPL